MLKEKRTPWASVARGAEGEPQRAGAAEENCKKIVFYTFEATNLLKAKEGECKTKLKTKLRLT